MSKTSRPALGGLLFKHRTAAGLSMSDVSQALAAAGIDRSRQSVHVWEKGSSAPPVAVLRELAEIYALSASQRVQVFNAADLLVIVAPTEAA